MIQVREKGSYPFFSPCFSGPQAKKGYDPFSQDLRRRRRSPPHDSHLNCRQSREANGLLAAFVAWSTT
jgi:hypothetical protein